MARCRSAGFLRWGCFCLSRGLAGLVNLRLLTNPSSWISPGDNTVNRSFAETQYTTKIVRGYYIHTISHITMVHPPSCPANDLQERVICSQHPTGVRITTLYLLGRNQRSSAQISTHHVSRQGSPSCHLYVRLLASLHFDFIPCQAPPAQTNCSPCRHDR